MIRMTRGSYGRRVGNVIRPVCTGETCTLATEEEERLVRLGVAVKVGDVERAVAPEQPAEQAERAAEPAEKAAAKKPAAKRAAAKKPKDKAKKAAVEPEEDAEEEAAPIPAAEGADAVVE